MSANCDAQYRTVASERSDRYLFTRKNCSSVAFCKKFSDGLKQGWAGRGVGEVTRGRSEENFLETR
jgi:hypothetical protein